MLLRPFLAEVAVCFQSLRAFSNRFVTGSGQGFVSDLFKLFDVLKSGFEMGRSAEAIVLNFLKSKVIVFYYFYLEGKVIALYILKGKVIAIYCCFLNAKAYFLCIAIECELPLELYIYLKQNHLFSFFL